MNRDSNKPYSGFSPSAHAFWDGLQVGELHIQKCLKCASLRHPPTSICAKCGSPEWTTITSSGRGKVYSWIVARYPKLPSPPAATDRKVVLVELRERVRVLGHMEKADEDVAIGSSVDLAKVGTFGDFPILVFRRSDRA